MLSSQWNFLSFLISPSSLVSVIPSVCLFIQHLSTHLPVYLPRFVPWQIFRQSPSLICGKARADTDGLLPVVIVGSLRKRSPVSWLRLKRERERKREWMVLWGRGVEGKRLRLREKEQMKIGKVGKAISITLLVESTVAPFRSLPLLSSLNALRICEQKCYERVRLRTRLPYILIIYILYR